MVATPTTASQSAERNYAAQFAVATALGVALGKAFRLIDPLRLADTLPLYNKAATALVRQHAAASRSLAVAHYMESRKAAGLTSTYRPPAAPLPPPEQVEQSVKWATDGLWSPQGGDLPTLADVQTTEANLSASLEKVTLDVGREQIIEAARADAPTVPNTVEGAAPSGRAVGYAREAQAGACWFCAMLSTRGAVYSSSKSAGDDQNRYHDHCRCQIVPVFGQYEPPAHVREWTAMWEKATADASGMKDKQNAFQEAFEGREIKRRTRGADKTKSGAKREPLTLDSMTLDQVNHQIGVVSALPDSAWKTAYLKKLQARASELAA